MKWSICSEKNVPTDFYKVIYKEENFLYIIGKCFVPENCRNFQKSYRLLRNSFCKFKEIFQNVYSIVYPEIYCATECRGFDLKSTFQLVFKSYKDKRCWNILVKSQVILRKKEMKHLGLNKHLLKISNFNDVEEREVNKKIENRKKKDPK